MKRWFLLFLLFSTQLAFAQEADTDPCSGYDPDPDCKISIDESGFVHTYYPPNNMNSKIKVEFHLFENSTSSMNYNYTVFWQTEHVSLEGLTTLYFTEEARTDATCGVYSYYNGTINPGETVIDTFKFAFDLYDCGDKFLDISTKTLDQSASMGYFHFEVLSEGFDIRSLSLNFPLIIISIAGIAIFVKIIGNHKIKW